MNKAIAVALILGGLFTAASAFLPPHTDVFWVLACGGTCK
jgi:hypothetical protein